MRIVETNYTNVRKDAAMNVVPNFFFFFVNACEDDSFSQA